MWPWWDSSKLFFAAKACMAGAVAGSVLMLVLADPMGALVCAGALTAMTVMYWALGALARVHENREEARLKRKQIVIRDFGPPGFMKKDRESGRQDEREPSDA